jgi:hypothetical protein
LLQPKSRKKNNAKEYTVNCSLALQTSHWLTVVLRAAYVKIDQGPIGAICSLTAAPPKA